MKRKLAAAAAGLSSLYWLAAPVLAQAPTEITIDQPEQVSINNLGPLISALIGILFIVAALIFFFMLLIGGIQWMTSGGDKAATEAARSRITAALIGLVIVFAAWALMRIVEAFFNITIISGTFNIPTPF